MGFPQLSAQAAQLARDYLLDASFPLPALLDLLLLQQPLLHKADDFESQDSAHFLGVLPPGFLHNSDGLINEYFILANDPSPVQRVHRRGLEPLPNFPIALHYVGYYPPDFRF